MDFLEKLNMLMDRDGYNKNSLSKACGIPYTTIDNWFKRGYDGLQLSTLKKLNGFFHTTLEFWSRDDVEDPDFGKSIGFELNSAELSHIKKYRSLDGHGKKMVEFVLDEEFQRMQRTIINDEEPDNIIELNELFQKASAGRGTFADDETTNIHKVKLNEYTRKADIIIHVYGDSMEPDYHDGDALLVHQQPSVDIGDIGIFIHQGERYVKKYGGKVLISLNKNYDSIPIDDTTICFGKVLGILKEEWIVE